MNPMTAARTRTVSIAYTPDSDDAYCYWGLESGRLGVDGLSLRFERDHIIALNRKAMRGRHDVSAISSAVYPLLADSHRVLSVGTSVGRGYGPVLAARQRCEASDLTGRPVGVAGLQTTGGFLAIKFCPGAEFVEMPYDRIADAILDGMLAGGVMIHEELLYFEQKRLAKVMDLGRAWCDQTGLPLPVGLNVVHRRVGDDASRLAESIRQSLRLAKANHEEAMAFAGQFGRGCSTRHVEMFANDDTLRLPNDVREAMKLLFAETRQLGLTGGLETFEVVE
jgi:1,4-dihydroxy-6-naphthoate synthase